MDKSTHEEHLSQPVQTNNNNFKIAVIFLTAYNGILNVTNSNNKSYFTKSNTDEIGFVQITIPPGAYPFKIEANSSTLGSTIEISPQGPIFSFMFDDSIRDV